MMKAFVIYGVSASGKSTFAQGAANENYTWWIERDIIRSYVYPNFLQVGWTGGVLANLENLVTYKWYVELNTAVERQRNLIISDTLCKIKDRRNLKTLLECLGFEIEWIRVDTPLEECIKRDSSRGIWTVGKDVILRQWENLQKHKEHV